MEILTVKIKDEMGNWSLTEKLIDIILAKYPNGLHLEVETAVTPETYQVRELTTDEKKKEQAVEAVLELLDGLLLNDANWVLSHVSFIIARKTRINLCPSIKSEAMTAREVLNAQ